MQVRKLATLREVCESRLAVSYQRGAEMVRTGILPPGVVVKLGRQVRIDLDRLEAWIAAGGAELPGGWKREAA